MASPYENLIVWQKSIHYVAEIYKITKTYPDDELYGLISQMRRSAVSIPSNIAEGAQRSSAKDFFHFLDIAQGSAAEIETQVIISKELSYITPTVCDQFLKDIGEIRKMLSGLQSALKL